MINKKFLKTKDEVEITFECDAPQAASEVAIVADFLDWQPEPMKKSPNQARSNLKLVCRKIANFSSVICWINKSGSMIPMQNSTLLTVLAKKTVC